MTAAVVTGGARALGQAIGRRLRDAGEVLLVDLDEAALSDVADELDAAHLALDLVAPARLALGLRPHMRTGSAI